MIGLVPESPRITRYEPEELLGSAGLVDTYRARIRGEEGLVALKVLFLDRAEPSVGRPVAERFLAAGRRAFASPVPGAARVLEVSGEVENAFVATELAPGVDLARVVGLARGRADVEGFAVEPGVAGLLCAQVASVLAGAHERKPPLFHLGLCPENVVATVAGEVKVLDFGLGAALRGAAGCPIEKWHFVAPELVGGDADTLSAEAARAADLYSLGALLHFLLLGRKPAEAVTLAELSQGIWEPLPEHEGLPGNLLSAVRALTAFEPGDRPDSARLVLGWLCDGGDVTNAHRARIARTLQALGVEPEPPPESVAAAASTRPAALSAADSAQRVALGTAPLEREGFLASKVRGQAAAKSTSAALPTRRDRHSRRLLVVGLVSVLGASAVGVEAYRWSRRPAPPADTDRVTAQTARESSVARRAEMLVGTARDGGGSGMLVQASESPPVELYVPETDSTPSRVPNHLFLDTSPNQADVWVDGVLRGRTPVDLAVGPGSHRVVAIKAGYRILRGVFDTTLGEYARRGLQRAGFPMFGDGLLEVQCATADRYPVLLDDEETGLLCPISRLPVASGKHHVGIFVPRRTANVTVEVLVPPGRQPKRVTFKE
jgi:hypothetical protein